LSAYIEKVLQQADLFAANAVEPHGLRYAEDVLSAAEEREAIGAIRELDLAPFQFHGYLGKRRVASFGWRYDYQGGGLQRAQAMPEFLAPLRARAATAAGLEADAFVQALVTEYAPGAGIGWHRDKPHFGKVAALSFAAGCSLRFRKSVAGGWERRALNVAPRSFYLLDGPARSAWEHSIAPTLALRYSVTFRTLVDGHA
jgi:alkylated DNA repair dioxygenase AlkB